MEFFEAKVERKVTYETSELKGMCKVIPSTKPYFPLEDVKEVKKDVEEILRSGMLTLHTYTRKFEEEFTRQCYVKHAVAVSSGTAALEIALRCMGLRAGDEVLVPTNTFSATAAAVFFAGGKPVLTDINPRTLCIDAENVQRYLTRNTKGVIIVHVGGIICPDIAGVRGVCEENNLFLIEDAAHAHGSTINDRTAGSLADIGCFSFYPTKVMTTGEGGMITTNNSWVNAKARTLRDQGKENFNNNTIVELGYNWRMDEISAAIGLVQLRRLKEIIVKRNRIAKYYDRELGKIKGISPVKTPLNSVNNYYKYIIILGPEIDRERFKENLRERGVKCGGEVYWPPLHLQPLYQRLLGTKKGDYPVAEDLCSRMICLPMYAQMTLKDARYVIEKIREVLSPDLVKT